MKTIWKFDVPIQDDFSILMPDGAKILKLDLQFGEPKIWALVDPDNEKKERFFIGRGTGHPMNETNICYVGTVVMTEGRFVFHLFEHPSNPHGDIE